MVCKNIVSAELFTLGTVSQTYKNTLWTGKWRNIDLNNYTFLSMLLDDLSGIYVDT